MPRSGETIGDGNGGRKVGGLSADPDPDAKAVWTLTLRSRKGQTLMNWGPVKGKVNPLAVIAALGHVVELMSRNVSALLAGGGPAGDVPPEGLPAPRGSIEYRPPPVA